MAYLNELLELYEEESLQSRINCTRISGKINWKKKPLFMILEKIEGNQALFSIGSEPVRFSLESDFPEMKSDNDSASSFRRLFWIDSYQDPETVIKYQDCGEGKIFSKSLDIGFGDEIVARFKEKKIETIADDLNKEFVFLANDRQYIFIRTYRADSDLHFTLYGLKKRAEISVDNNKWIIRKITNKPFPRKYDEFIQLNVLGYEKINLTESSKAKETYETFLADYKAGNALLALWKMYSQIELRHAELIRDQLGEMAYCVIRSSVPDEVKIRFNNPTGEQRNYIKEHSEDLLGLSLERVNKNDKNTKEENPAMNQAPFNNKPSIDKTAEKYKIKRVNNDLTFDLYDENNTLQSSGILSVSIKGDEIVHKRRERALRSLTEDRKLITRNLLFAIEGKNDAMLEKNRNEKPVTERTKLFLKKHFGIDNLTDNQREALEIALNTPDIAVIQGPPGTGKTTVVAAIADRLLELAEKNKKSDSKMILVSAYQNDTVEHIASKIHTLGLPTIKIGRETQGNIRAEDKLIEDMKTVIDRHLHNISASANVSRNSRKLKEFRDIYLKEKNIGETVNHIRKMDIQDLLSDDLSKDWKEIMDSRQIKVKNNDHNRSLLKGIRTDSNSYNDDGYYRIQKLLKSGIPFTDDELNLLRNAPVLDPSNEFLECVAGLRENYLEKTASDNVVQGYGCDTALLNWLNESIAYFTHQEETSCEDVDTFIAVNLESLREELEGNPDYVRDAIKDYGESLAATNQVAGSYEMNEFNDMENVILEEAARSNPLDLLIPMSKAIERIIMVGDQKQLPHILEDSIVDEVAQKQIEKTGKSETVKGLEESLFGVIFRNLYNTKPKRSITLTEQFRMHPFIGNFISRVYYEGVLKSGMPDQEEQKQHNISVPWAKGKVAVLCNVSRKYGPENRGKSKSRPAEARKIIQLLDELKSDPEFNNISVGIITFYAKQVEEIFEEASNRGYAERRTDGVFEISNEYKRTADNREKLRIGSVDSFQGKEFDVVILSTVRSNEIERVDVNERKVFGFLTLENRLNVAFSRAQKLLIVVGDREMFKDDFAKTYVEGLYEFCCTLATDKKYGNIIE